MSAAKTSAEQRTKHKSVDLTRMRDVLEELAQRQDRSALLDVVFDVLLKADKVIENQAVEIEHLRKQLFGRRSEKVSPDQLSLFASMLQTVVEQQSESNTEQDDNSKPAGKPRKKRKQKRRELKPTEIHDIPVPAEQRPCPECGQQRCTLGHLRSVVIEYTPPKINLIEYRREKIVCRACEGEITLAPPPHERLFERATPGPQRLAALAVNKGVDGLPLHRTHKIFARSGLDIPVQTLNRWEGFGYQLLEPVIGRVRAALLRSDTINLDDTGLRVRDPTLKPGIVGGHIGVFVGRTYDPDGDLSKTQEVVFYLYAPTWQAKYPEELLHGCPAVLQGDAYRGYERIADANRGDAVHKLLAGCCMHARRPFVQALQSKDPSAIFFVERFQSIYRFEAKARVDGLSASQRLELRKQHSLPLMNEIHERAQELQPLPLAKPMKTGVTYLLNPWDKLLVPFKQDGRLEIDNGSAERRLRRVASGRKSWFFAGSHGGAERLAGILSLVSSAEAAGVDPGSYIADILPRIDAWPNRRIDELLPNQWRALNEKAAE